MINCRQAFKLIINGIIALSMLTSCANIYLPVVVIGEVTGTNSLPEYPLYVLARNVEYSDGLRYNELVIVDPETWSVVRRTVLPGGTPWNIDRDPVGRLWVSYASMPGEGDNRVVVLSAEGELEKVLRPCANPYQGVHFNDESAFATCAMNGFYAKVVVMDLQNFAITETVDVQYPDTFLLNDGDSIDRTLLLFGGGDTQNRIALFDTQTYTVTETVLHDFSMVFDIVHYVGTDNVIQFYLLNQSSYQFPEESDALLRLDLLTSPTLTEVSLPVLGPTWGIIAEDQLYSYHNPQYGTTSDSPLRAISRLDLTTGETEWWPLPDSWNAGDIAWIEGKLILPHARSQDPAQVSGLYEFNPETGALTPLLHLPGALRLLPTAP
jgi:hypothetical protein